MRAIYKKNDLEYTIFNVRDDKNGYPHFLVYMCQEWKYVSAKYFKVITEEQIQTINNLEYKSMNQLIERMKIDYEKTKN